MGYLKDFDLEQLCERHGCLYLVSIGAGRGRTPGVLDALSFRHAYVIEPQHQQALVSAIQYSSNRDMTIMASKALNGLREVLPQIPADAPVIFWHDAHDPSPQQAEASFDPAKLAGYQLPLEQELRLIKASRDISRDIFLVDDIRLYEDAAYEQPELPEGTPPLNPAVRNLNFVADILGATHRIERRLSGTGALCAFPKG